MKISLFVPLAAALCAAAPLAAQFAVTDTIVRSDWHTVTDLGSGSGTNPDGGIGTGTTTINGTTFPTFIAGGTSGGPNAASALLDSAITTYSMSSTFDGTLYLTFSAERANTGSGDTNWANFKLGRAIDQNNGIILGLGGIVSGNLNNWYAGEGYASGTNQTIFTNTAAIGTAVSMSSSLSYITVMIDYAANDDDRVYIWRTNGALDLHNLDTASAGYTQTGNYAFDRLELYAGNNVTLGFSDMMVAVPEPSTAAFVLGTAVLGVVGWRRFRRRA